MRMKIFLAMIYAVTLSVQSLAQTPNRRPANPASQVQEQSPNLQPNASAIEIVANELGLLRKSLQTLNTRLREISERFSASDPKQSDSPVEQQNRISRSLDLLSRAEQRAEVLRRQLLDLIEKETSVRTRLVQLEEEIRPESIERAASMVGSTRTMELRDARRRVLDNERKGQDSLLNQIAQSRVRLEDDVRQADAMVSRLRQRVLPLIEKEIDKINPTTN